MKKLLYSAALIVASTLAQLLFCMENPTPESTYAEWPCKMPSKIWVAILSYVPVDSKIIKSSKDIYQALDKIKPYIINSLRTMFLTCQNFNSLKPHLIKSKDNYYRYFRHYLTEEFLDIKLLGSEFGFYSQTTPWFEGTDDISRYNSNLFGEGLYRLIEEQDLTLFCTLLTMTPLKGHQISSDNWLKLCRIASFYGANVNAEEIEGNNRNPLMIAISQRNDAAVNFLLCHQADINHRTHLGSTPLITAVFFCSTETIKLLLEYGCNINAQDNGGATALIRAIQWSHFSVLPLLLAHPDINFHLKTEEGKTALDILKEDSSTEAQKFLPLLKAHPSSLREWCLRYIGLNKKSYMNTLNILPAELLRKL